MSPATANLMSVDEALSRLIHAAQVVPDDATRPLNQALGSILAESPVTGVTVPPADNSAVDGYALNSRDAAESSLPVSQRIAAGQFPDPLTRGTAARIFTGAAIPEGADTVVMQENTELRGAQLILSSFPGANQNIRPAGQDIRAGDTLIEKGTRLQPWHLGLLASAGLPEVRVYRPLRIAVLSSGDELVAPGKALAAGQIYNSNQIMLQSLVSAAGWEVLPFDTMADTLDATRHALGLAGDNADAIITTGGVSVGEEDHIRDAIKSLGTLDLWRMAIKPGKPLAFGTIGNTPILGLPGNPAAVLVTFLILARPFLRCCQGESGSLSPGAYSVPLGFPVARAQSRREYQRVRCRQLEGRQWLEAASNQSSGVLSTACSSDGLAVIPENETREVGDSVHYYPFSSLLHG